MMLDCAGVPQEGALPAAAISREVERINSVWYLHWLLKQYVKEMRGIQKNLGRTSQSSSDSRNFRREDKLAKLRDRCAPFVIQTLRMRHGVTLDAAMTAALTNCGVKL